MGYDRQRSPFATRLFLTCYSTFLLINLLLYSNDYLNKTSQDKEEDLDKVLLCFVSLSIFSIGFYGLWFAKLFILYLLTFLLSIFVCTTCLSIIFISMNQLQNKFSLYTAHNYIWLMKSSLSSTLIIYLLISMILNSLAIWSTCHLCSCIEHRHDHWPFRKKTMTHTII